MSDLYRIEHPGAEPTVVRAASLVVHEGFLHALRHSGSYEPGRETEASWAPGTWTSFQRSLDCPKCGQSVKQW